MGKVYPIPGKELKAAFPQALPKRLSAQVSGCVYMRVSITLHCSRITLGTCRWTHWGSWVGCSDSKASISSRACSTPWGIAPPLSQDTFSVSSMIPYARNSLAVCCNLYCVQRLVGNSRSIQSAKNTQCFRFEPNFLYLFSICYFLNSVKSTVYSI